MAYHLAQEWLTLNTSVSFMGSSSNVFMRWRGVILEVFMYLFNKRRRTIFGEYEVHKQEVLGISLFLWAAPSYLRGRSCKRDLLTRPHPNLTPQSWGMPLTVPEACDLGRGTPKSHSSGWLSNWPSVGRLWVFSPTQVQTGLCSELSPPTNTRSLILAYLTWHFRCFHSLSL